MKFLVLALLLTVSCTTAPKASATSSVSFDSYLTSKIQELWKVPHSAEVDSALTDFMSAKKINGKMKYGEKARTLDIRSRTLRELTKMARKNGFKLVKCTFWDFSKNPREVLLDLEGRPLPLWAFVHPDGSKVRVKPKGDPYSKFRKPPDAVKAVMYPHNADPCEYNAEVFLVDYVGLPLPKQPKFLADSSSMDLSNKESKAQFLTEWAERTHAYLLAEPRH